ncbi:MAG: radical SAM protein [Candidatus Thorarchaeota archaeon]
MAAQIRHDEGRGTSNMNAEELLRLKIRLLTEGVMVDKGEWAARRGGAGPVGAKYFIIPNGRPVGVPLRRGEQAQLFGAAPLEPTDNPDLWLYEQSIPLRVIPRPRFYDLTTKDGVPYRKIALLHGSETLATTAYQACRYWSNGLQCRFCTIPFSLYSGDTVLEKRPEQLAEVVQAAEAEGVIKNILITTGTPDSPDAGAKRLAGLVRAIRDVSRLPIGVQFEPPTELRFIEEVAAAGANAVGMHIESGDERIRQRMCPGKYRYGSLDMYRRAWDFALDFFGRGNVSTFVLYGLGEDIDRTLSFVADVAETGVLPVVTPFRPAPKSLLADFVPSYVGSIDASMAFYKRVGEILFDNRLNPDETAAGCHKCGGCTPIQEAYDWAASRG